jgi:hypothetical protein
MYYLSLIGRIMETLGPQTLCFTYMIYTLHLFTFIIIINSFLINW